METCEPNGAASTVFQTCYCNLLKNCNHTLIVLITTIRSQTQHLQISAVKHKCSCCAVNHVAGTGLGRADSSMALALQALEAREAFGSCGWRLPSWRRLPFHEHCHCLHHVKQCQAAYNFWGSAQNSKEITCKIVLATTHLTSLSLRMNGAATTVGFGRVHIAISTSFHFLPHEKQTITHVQDQPIEAAVAPEPQP